MIARDGFNFELWFWLIIGVVWLVAQIARSARRQAQRNPPPTRMVPPEPPSAPSEEGPWEKQLQEFLESLGTGEMSRPPPPPEEAAPGPAPEPVPVRVARDAKRPSRPVRSPTGAPPRTAGPAAPAAARRFPQPPPVPSADTAFLLGSRRTGATGSGEILRMASPFKMPSFSMSTPKPPAPPSALAAAGWRQDRAAFRRAMISHIVLGKPRALDPSGGQAF